MLSTNSKLFNYCYTVAFPSHQIHTLKINNKRLKCKNK